MYRITRMINSARDNAAEFFCSVQQRVTRRNVHELNLSAGDPVTAKVGTPEYAGRYRASYGRHVDIEPGGFEVE